MMLLSSLIIIDTNADDAECLALSYFMLVDAFVLINAYSYGSCLLIVAIFDACICKTLQKSDHQISLIFIVSFTLLFNWNQRYRIIESLCACCLKLFEIQIKHDFISFFVGRASKSENSTIIIYIQMQTKKREFCTTILCKNAIWYL